MKPGEKKGDSLWTNHNGVCIAALWVAQVCKKYLADMRVAKGFSMNTVVIH